MTDLEKRLDQVEIEVEKEPNFLEQQSEFMQSYKEVAAALPDSHQDKLLDLEANVGTMFILACRSAYMKGLRDAGRLALATAGPR